MVLELMYALYATPRDGPNFLAYQGASLWQQLNAQCSMLGASTPWLHRTIFRVQPLRDIPSPWLTNAAASSPRRTSYPSARLERPRRLRTATIRLPDPPDPGQRRLRPQHQAMPQKRKRPDEPAAQPEPQASSSASSSTRRATRQTPVHPPPVPAAALLPPTLPATHKMAAPVPAVTAVPLPQIPLTDPQKRSARNGPRPPGAKPSPLPSLATAAPRSPIPPPLSPGSVKVAASMPPRRGVTAAEMSTSVSAKDRRRPSDLVAPEITYHVPQANQQGRQSSLVRPHGPSAPPPRIDKIGAAPMVVTPVLPPKPPTLPVSDRPPPRTDRNIDKVVLGNLCFRTWYPSYYGKEVLGAASGNAKGGSKDGLIEAVGKVPSKKEKDNLPMLERLYVCPSCFKYAKELVAWWGHVKLCQQQAHVPGKKVYIHPKGRRTVYVAQDGSRGPGQKKRRGEGSLRYIEEVVQDEGEWSLWEVDGEQDVLFCQNLSLFAKLFLDNKSVFFDVTGFNYFLLVYTPPTVAASSGVVAPPVTPQITGFFSKEKMSWDNNNLACILMFPPWQRKGLGALLMGASYEISRREGIMGGPEKPISDLGKKGYQRFWAGEIARWLLGLDVSRAGLENSQETLVDVEDCSQATWITPEDCLGVLRDMGIVEDAGVGPGKPEPLEDQKLQLSEEENKKKPAAGEEEAKINSKGASAEAEDEKQKVMPAVQEVPRVRVDKEAVRRYVAAHRIVLEKTCDPDGFIEGYAMKAVEKASSESAESRDETMHG
ncbi:acyl- n-acyltransferase [Trichoderma arundinaceum]|uniref:histone acetyltransferase n=1 Tax=Trichoderma arundinaceum TaxID=490622 RepID=A0A395NNW6_TRIAR|nr:acyl- n-acyltransferase [Trichoderma arundinaceum]